MESSISAPQASLSPSNTAATNSNGNGSSIGSSNSGSGSNSGAASPAKDPTVLVAQLKAQHRQLGGLFSAVLGSAGKERARHFADLQRVLRGHEKTENSLIHPAALSTAAARNSPSQKRMVARREAEEQENKRLLGKLEKLDVDSLDFETKLNVLRSNVLAHAAAEEKFEFNMLQGVNGQPSSSPEEPESAPVQLRDLPEEEQQQPRCGIFSSPSSSTRNNIVDTGN